jgi:hypothetical protein
MSFRASFGLRDFRLRDFRRLRLESLERRELLAGNVQASVVGSKLLLTGDNLGNNVAVVALGGGRYAVSGVATTVNGGNAAFVTPRSVAHLSATLNGGNDVLALTNDAQALYDMSFLSTNIETRFGIDAATLQGRLDAIPRVDDFSLSGSLTVAGGAGDDVVASVGSIGGSAVVSLGPATTVEGNAFGIDGASLAGGGGRVGGAISVVGDGQADEILIEATRVRGSVSASLGNGDNSLNTRDSNIDGGLSYVGGMDSDRPFLFNSTIAGHVGFVLGQGENLAGVNGSSIGSLAVTGGAGRDAVLLAVRAQNSVSIWTGAGEDSVSVVSGGGPQGQPLGPSFVGGHLTIDTGSGDDFVELQANVRHSLVLTLGDGMDRLEFLGVVVGFNATIDAGNGDDSILIAQSNVGYFLYVFAGAGNDRVTITETDARAAYLFGGLGNDDRDVDAATLAAVDFLFQTDFEM